MNVVVGYCFPTVDTQTYIPMARKFVSSYLDNPPGAYPHKVAVLVNGPTYPAMERTFSPLAVEFHQHNNYGRDLGAYQMAAATIPCDLLLCIGAPARPVTPGWLDWIVQIYLDNGPGLYGVWGMAVPKPHLRTTCFWLPPDLLNSYPYEISDSKRYSVEHGADSLTLWSQRSGFGTWQVTKKGVFDMPNWHNPPKHECLFEDQFSAQYL